MMMLITTMRTTRMTRTIWCWRRWRRWGCWRRWGRWGCWRRFNTAPKEIRAEGESNNAGNKLAQRDTNRWCASFSAFSIYSKMQSSLSAHRHRYSCPRWELHHLQQDVIVAVCSSPSLQLYENGSSILAFVSRVQLAANTLQVFKDVIQAQLPTAVWIADFR